MFRRSPRRPYITCESEQELYDQEKEWKPSIKEQLNLNYNQIKELNRHFVITRADELTFGEVATWICNDDLHMISSENVYYLMTFISLGALAAEFNENVSFVKYELGYIIRKDLLEKMKPCINYESYIDMKKDYETIKQYFYNK